MDASFVAKIVAAGFCLAVFVASSLTTPPIVVDPVLRGALLAAGLAGLGINITGAVTGARQAGARTVRPPQYPPQPPHR